MPSRPLRGHTATGSSGTALNAGLSMTAASGRAAVSAVTIRFSRTGDDAEIAKLAQLDSAPAPRGRLLVAEVAGELRAALPLDGGRAVADPFRHTQQLVSLLELRRRQTGRRTAVRRWPPRRYALA